MENKGEIFDDLLKGSLEDYGFNITSIQFSG